jgi:HD-like signal output (HDOD) protein/CheY-like chemotaxis protein
VKKILIVDDEVQILKALVRLFMDTDYEVVTAESGAAALEILEQEQFNMIISDMKMPYMDGYELLSKVKELYPKTVRIILSGYSEEKVVFHALQKNIARLYVFKPWKNDELIQIVTQLLETEDILNNSNLLNFINNVENLPTIKTSYQRIINLINDDTDIISISNEIERDISISAKILNVANSAYYGAKTGSVKQAVTYIGLHNTKKLVITTSIIETMNEKSEAGEMIKNIWIHSFLSNRLLAFLYEKFLHKRIPDLYSSAALLHNIGEIFFLKYFFQEYVTLLLRAKTETEEISKLEKKAFTASHSEAGAYLLEWWEFPFPIVETALYHHNPLDEKVINKELVCAVHIVIKYATELLGYKWTEGFDSSAFDYLNISKNDFEAEILKFN